MEKMEYQKGIGVIAVVAILAVIAVGGFATVKVVQNSRVAVDTEAQEEAMQEEAQETVAAVRADVVSTFSNVKANLVLSAQTSVDAAVVALDNLSARVDAASMEVQGEARTEIDSLKAEIEKLKAKVRARSNTVVAEISAFVDDVRADIKADLEIEVDGSASGDTMPEGEAMEDDGSMVEEMLLSMEK